MSLWNRYLSWRHSKGYGVHSHYAYRFIMDVLHPGPYRFYSYDEIGEFLEPHEIHKPSLIRLTHFTIRLVSFLKIKRIISAGQDLRFAELAAKALKISYLEINDINDFKFEKGSLLILSRLSFSNLDLRNDIPLFALNPSPIIRKILETPISNGLLLNDKKKMILIPRKEMEYVRYDINLKAR